MHLRQRFEVADIRLLILAEDDSRVEDVFGVKQALYLLHQFVRLITPLSPNERCHVTACAMLGFQAAVVLIHHKIDHSVHHTVVLRYGLRRIETLVKDEVVVALERMPVDDRVGVVMFAEKLLQVNGGLRQMFDGESNVLDEAGCAYGTRATHSREDSRTHRPILGDQRFVGCDVRRLAQRIG